MRSLSIIALATVLNLSSAFAAPVEVSNFAATRALDGRWQACTTKGHLNRTSWVLENANIQGLAEHKIRVTGKAVFVRCVQNPQAENDPTVAPVKWTQADPHTSTTHVNSSGESYTKRFDKIQLLTVNVNHQILVNSAVESGSEYMIDEELTVDQFLTANQQLDLQDGKPVLTRIITLPRAMTLITYEGQAEESLGMSPWGSYTMSFRMQKTTQP